MPQEKLSAWIDENVTSHYRIFGEYWEHLGRKTGDEYMPAFTPSALRFLDKQSNEVERLVMPFIGLAALKKVGDRRDLVGRVIEWGEREGREVVEGLDQLQRIVRLTSDDEEKNKLLLEVKQVLTSQFHPMFQVAVSCVALLRGDPKAGAGLLGAYRTGRTYRWLWQIRAPELRHEWGRALENLMR